ncbi:MAG: hypothetical protein E6G57_14065 [Actinobacteria bacterium]|nr:MAG: hypothetical protein E6G57_14065 [Actinomycetota bacterium]
MAQTEKQPNGQTSAVVSHGLLTSMAVVTAGVATVRDHWGDLSPTRREYLLERVLAHAGVVSDGLRDLARGLPEETVAQLEAQQRHRQ